MTITHSISMTEEEEKPLSSSASISLLEDLAETDNDDESKKLPAKKKNSRSLISKCKPTFTMLIVFFLLFIPVVIWIIFLLKRPKTGSNIEKLTEILTETDQDWLKLDKLEEWIGGKEEHFKGLKPFNKVLWSYWDNGGGDSGKTPSLVKVCLNRFRSKNIGWEVNILNNKNLRSFLSEEEMNVFLEIGKSSGIPAGTDLLRLILLWRFGGVWLDASTIITKEKDMLDTLLEGRGIMQLQKENLKKVPRAVLVMRLPHWQSGDDKEGYVAPMIENWFIACRPKSRYIGLWLKQFLIYQKLRMFNKNNYLNFGGSMSLYKEDFDKRGYKFYGNKDFWEFGDYLTMHWSSLYVIQEERKILMEFMWKNKESYNNYNFFSSSYSSLSSFEDENNSYEESLGVLRRCSKFTQPWPKKKEEEEEEAEESKDEYFNRLSGFNPAIEVSLKVEILDAMSVAFEPMKYDHLLWSHFERFFKKKENSQKLPRFFF